MPTLTCARCGATTDARSDLGALCAQCAKATVSSSATVVERSGHETLPAQVAARSARSADASRSVLPEEGKSTGAKRFGRFELRSLLGRGAFGQVFRAHDPQLDREVAIKIPKLDSDRGTVERFLREGKAAARLHHPNIVPTYESGRLDGRYYIASQFVEGQTLAARIARGPVSLRDAAQWARELASGLAYAHEQQVIHRDVKPANVMLDQQGRPRLMDFGLAKRLTEDASQTVDGTLMGTPAYMAPEQAKGASAEVGPAADQYSLGVVLYELLVGRTPFQGSPHHQVAQHIAAEPSPPRSFRAEIPVDLQAICLKSLSKDPAARYESTADLAEDLGRWLRGEPTRARPVAAPERLMRWARRNPAVAALSVAVALALLSGTIVSAAFAWRANIVSIAEAKARGDAERAASRAESEAARAAAETENAKAAKADAEAKAEVARRAEAEARVATRRAEAEAAAARAAELAADEASMREAKEAAAAKVAQTLAATEAASARAAEERAAGEAIAARTAEKEALHAFALSMLDEAPAVAERGDVSEAVLMYAEGADAARRADDPELARSLAVNVAAWEAFCPKTLTVFDMPSNVAGTREADVTDFAGSDRFVVARSGGPEVYVWSAANFDAPPRVLLHPAPVRGVAGRPHHGFAATTCDDGRFRIWDLEQGREIVGGRAETSGAGDSRLSFDRSEERVSITNVIGDESGGKYASFVFDFEGKVLKAFLRPDEGDAIGFDRSGRLASCRRDPQSVSSATLIFGRGARWQEKGEMPIPYSIDDGASFAFARDGTVAFASSGLFSVLRVPMSGGERAIPASLGDQVALNSIGDLAAINSPSNRSACVYDAQSLALLSRLPGAPRGCPAFGENGSELLILAEESGLRRYAPPERRRAASFVGEGPVVALKFSPDGTRLAAVHGARHRTLRILDVALRRAIVERPFPAKFETPDRHDLHDVDFVGDASTVLFAYDERTWIWRIGPPGTGESRIEQDLFPLPMNAVQKEHARQVESIGRDGSALVAAAWSDFGGSGSRLYECRFANRADAVPLNLPASATSGRLLRSDDGRRIALVGDRVVEAYELSDLRAKPRVVPYATFARASSHFAVAALDSKGERLAYGSPTGKAMQYDLSTSTAIDGTMRHEGEATCAKYHPGGAYLIVGATDGSVTVCDAKSGHRVGPRFVQAGPIVSLDVSADGAWIAAGDQAGEVSVWRAPPVIGRVPSDVLAYVRARTGIKRGAANDGRAKPEVAFASREEWLAASADEENAFGFVTRTDDVAAE